MRATAFSAWSADPLDCPMTGDDARAGGGRRDREPLSADDDLIPLQHWEQRYAGTDAVWSGKVNPTLASALEHFPPGRSLDLGCGEGADVIWLAERGWDALGLDLSPTAVERARAAAAARGLGSEPADAPQHPPSVRDEHTGTVRFEQCDLTAWTPEADAFDLVTASFFHSRATLARTAILRRALDAVAPGGRLVVLSHAAPPPWSAALHSYHEQMLSAREECQQLAPDPQRWELEVAAQYEREATGPDGTPAHLEDSLLVLRRRG